MDSGPTPQQRVETAFRRVIASVVLFNEQVAHRTGLSLTESQFLHLLEIHGPMSPSELGRSAELTSGTVTGVLDRLEELGFVRRDRHPHDRRKVIVVLQEEKVRATVAPHFHDRGRWLAEVMDGFDPADLHIVADFLETLTRRD